VGIGSVAVILVSKRYRPNWPGMLIAVATAAILAAVFRLSVDTIGSRFGGIPHGLPMPRLPPITSHLIQQVLPAALSFTFLGGIESLLSAKVADGMTGRKHRSNMELVAQGIANMASAVFGGISVTGTIARTATNVRAGARSPISGMMHAGLILLFMLVAAPLASFIPLAALAGVLVVVCWNMAEKLEFVRLLQHWRLATVLLTTFGLIMIKDLTFGIVAGCLVAALLAVAHRYLPRAT
jgi:SulP family sulfate permease